MVKLKCQKCGWIWDYRGKRTYYAMCPNCRRQVNMRKEGVSEEDST